ncbi:MAG: hypothetical protein JSS83_09525 [Cyanobacteria bacterium SZAS LIN-3]|nr:hypothetical protein [Cyanobacteria bacterium SZAS LIN-3]
MHDCPACKVPLHGYEPTCPACGAPQKVTRGYSKLLGDEMKRPKTNPMPFVLVTIVLVAGLVFMGQQSWVGQLLTRGPVKEDPIAKMTFQEARTLIDTKLNEGFTTAGVAGTVKWQRAGADVDKLSPGSIEVTVDAPLNDPEQHKGIVDPIKDYMAKAEITSLVFNNTKDPKKHQNWTYNVSVAPAATGDAAAPDGGAAPAQ